MNPSRIAAIALSLLCNGAVLAAPPISTPEQPPSPARPAPTPAPAPAASGSSVGQALAGIFDWRRPDDGAYRVVSEGSLMIRAQCGYGGFVVVANHANATPEARNADLRAACKRSNFGTMDDNSTR